MSRRYAAVSAVLVSVAALSVAPGAQAASAPAQVSGLAAYQQRGAVTVRWTNPSGIDRDIVRIARGSDAPATPSDGRGVALAHPRSSLAVLAHLAPSRQYSIAIWTRRGDQLSRRAATTFTTKPVAQPRGQGTFAGQVVDSAGDPLQNAAIFAVDFNTLRSRLRTRSDQAGMFRLAVPAGRYLFAVLGQNAIGGDSDRGGYLYNFRQVRVVGGQVRDLRIVLRDGGAIRGVITDGTGHPVAGAAMLPSAAPAYLNADMGGISISFGESDGLARTNSAGQYRLKGLAPGTEIPCAEDARYVARCAGTSVAVRAGRVTSAAPLALQSAPKVGHGTLTGIVTDANSHPVSGAEVGVETADSAIYTRTNPRGRFVFHNVPAGVRSVCAARGGFNAKNPGADACRKVTVVAHHSVAITLRFKPVGALSGVVRGPSGDRLGNIAVIAEHESAHSVAGYFGQADSRGNWTIRNLPPGKYALCFQTDGTATAADPTGARSACTAQKYLVVAGRDRIGVDHTLAAGGAITGTVLRASGHPAAGVPVVVIRKARFAEDYAIATTGRDGRFHVKGLRPGMYRVCAEREYESGTSVQRCGADAVQVVVRRTSTVADITLPMDAPLRVTVTDGSGNPLSGVDVGILRACTVHDFGCPGQPVFNATKPVIVAASQDTGVDGTVTMHGLKPGHYVACALAYYAASSDVSVPTMGYADKCTGSTFGITVTRGSTATATIPLDPGAAVSGLVEDSHGAPVRGVTVDVARSAAFDYTNEFGFSDPLMPSPRKDVVTSRSGTYIVRSVAPGDRKLCGKPAARTPLRRGCLADPVTLAAGTTTMAPTLSLAARAMQVHPASRTHAVRALLSRMPGMMRALPVNRRIPVITPSGWPEFRLLPRR